MKKVILLLLIFYSISYSQWELLKGPSGGSISGITRTSKSTFFISTDIGVYRTTDNAVSWVSVNNGLPFFFQITGTWICGEDNLVLFWNYGHYPQDAKIWFTKNCGVSWDILRNSSRMSSALVKNGVIFICYKLNGGPYMFERSTDGGNTWDALNSTYLGDLFSKDNYIYSFSAPHKILYRTSDYGNNWDSLTLNHSISYMHAGGTYLVGSGPNIVYRSSDNGINWDSIYVGRTYDDFYSGGNNLYARNGWDWTNFKSTDFGLHWDTAFIMPHNSIANSIIPKGDTIFAATDSGIVVSYQNGTSWERRNNGISTFWIKKIFSNGSTLLANTTKVRGSISYSTDNGNSWSDVYSVHVKGHVSSFSYLQGKYFAATDSSLYFTANLSSDWTDMKTGIPWSGGVNTISAIQNQLFLYTPLNGIKRSTDLGYTWIDVTTPSGGDITSFHDINSAIYAVNTGLYKSSDLGASWILAFSEGGENTFNITHIGSALFASSKNGVYMSTNAGNNWIIKNNNLPTDFLSADITSINGNLYVCYRGLGVYKSSNSGDNWTLLNDNLSNIDAYCITANNDYVYTGTFVNLSSCHESGVFRISDLTAIRSINNKIPKSYILYQNYPNPFNPTTKIKFEIPSNVKSETSKVKLIIYDILGNEVATLVNEKLSPGTYEVEWSAEGGASNFASGVYFYTLKTENFTETKKMILIK